MALKKVEIDRVPRNDSPLSDASVKAIHATCDACGDGREHRYVADGANSFQAIQNSADSGLPSGYRVRCPAGHGEGFTVAEIFNAS
jgi:hypothetical protein